MAKDIGAENRAGRKHYQKVKAALEFAGELIGIGVKARTGIVSLKAQHGLNTRQAKGIWRAKTRKGYRHH